MFHCVMRMRIKLADSFELALQERGRSSVLILRRSSKCHQSARFFSV